MVNEMHIIRLMRSDPASLIQSCIHGTMRAADLSFAAEEIGHARGVDVVHALTALRTLLRHASPIVREGALYGVANLFSDRREWRVDVVSRVREMAACDPSPGVRSAAADVLEEIDDDTKPTGGRVGGE